MINQTTVITYAVLIGLTPLIPIPILDDLVKSFFYKSLVRTLATRYKLSLNDIEIDILTEDRGRGIKGCLIGTLEYIVKSLIRKLTVVLEWRRAIDLVTHAYYFGYLLDYAFQQGWYTPGDSQQALRLRAAIEMARKNANTNLVKNIVQTSFNQSRSRIMEAVQQVSRSLQDIAFRRSRIWLRRQLAVRLRRRTPRLARWLYRLLRLNATETAQVVEVENVVAEKLEQESPYVKSMLKDLVSGLQKYIEDLPQDHFERLQDRLKEALKSAPATG